MPESLLGVLFLFGSVFVLALLLLAVYAVALALADSL